MSELSDFVARYGKPYDAASDTYRRPPFATPVKAGKNTPIYNAHSYHTKVPPQGIVPYIEHYTDLGDLVLDPFCGSGMTGVACLMTGRRAVLNDLSPAAVHIAYNYCTPVDIAVLKSEFARIQVAVKEEFDWLYGTTCDRCGGQATIHYTVWSDVFACDRCGHEVRAMGDEALEMATSGLATLQCASCGRRQSKREATWLRSEPVLTSYECPTCQPRRSDHPTTSAEKALIADISEAQIPYWYPTADFGEGWEMWRGEHREQGINSVDRFFTNRNLRAFARLWWEAGKASPREAAATRFCLTAILNYVNKKQSYGGGGGGMSGTLYVPSLVMEKNVGLVASRKFVKVAEVLGRMPAGQVHTRCGTASDFSELADKCVDYVFTDPPFGSNIFYADCNLLWEAWLGQGFTDQSLEAVVHVKHKDKNTLPDYSRLMTDSLREMFRVLKPGRWASVIFHNSDDRIWQTILDGIQAAGFELAEINSFDKEQLSFKGVRGAKGLENVTNKDIVLNLHKPGPQVTLGANDAAKVRRGNGDTEIRIVERVAQYLTEDHGPQERTLQALWNEALGEMIRNQVVEVSMEEVGRMLPYYFKQVDGAWYLRGQAVMGGRMFDVATDAGALVWLGALLTEPKALGDLIPEWQKASAQARVSEQGRLERLLEENFVQDRRSGRWRVPTEQERMAMSAQENISAQAHLRVVRRFLAGELPTKPTPTELAAWIQFCYSRGAYAEAVQLFSLLDASQLSEDHRRMLERIAAVCRIRSGGSRLERGKGDG